MIQRVETDSEKIALNCLLLLIVTGFRSVEVFYLRHDALVRRQIDDPTLRKRFLDRGLPDYFLGIHYVGVKGAGERTHWVEPLAVPLVESIFSTVKKLTTSMRNHLTDLREESFKNYLPKAISALPGELVELDHVVAHITQTTSTLRGRAGQRDKTAKALTKRGVLPVHEVPGPRNSKSVYYSKSGLSDYIKNEFEITETHEPCTHSWTENGKQYNINHEDLLFLHAKGSLSLRRTLELKAVPVPFLNSLMNKFLGNVETHCSVFSKYQLLEDDSTPTQMRTHIPRHNINTFLAIAEISDHLQAMLMGRVDITQNHHYQHLALAERRKSASLVQMQPTSAGQVSARPPLSTTTPLNVVRQTGFMVIPKNMALENAIRTNLHTFDERSDIAGFIEDAFAEGLFEDIANAFEEIRDTEGPEQASAMVERHAVLYPLKFGSCMREVNLWGCPYRLKCQSIAFCEHFTLTGRIDELPNIEAKIYATEKAYLKLSSVIDKAPCYNAQLTEIVEKLERLKIMQKEWLHHANSKQVTAFADILSGEIKTEGNIRTLTQLFALEYQKSKTGEI